jgi:uncharacterized protein (DUF362 family)
MVRVSLVRGDNSYDAVRKALELVRRDVKVLKGKRVLVKPNLVSPTIKDAATPVEAVRATLDFLQELGVRRFIVGESSAVDGDTMGAFERFGYLPLRDSYDVELRDLNKDEKVGFEVVDADLKPVTIRLARSYLDSYLVSVARMKTHNRVVVTLAIKNVVIASIFNPDRKTPFSHASRAINISMARISEKTVPGLAVIDGVVGMEGNGPVDGTLVPSGMALASTDALALDMVGSQAMDFDWRTIGYIWYLTQLRSHSWEEIKIVGEDLMRCMKRFKPHEDLSEQLTWWVEDWRSYLGGDYLRS